MADKVKEPEKKPVEGQDPPSGTSPKGDEPYEYQDPLLKGKSPQEIEELFRMSQTVVSGQKGKLERADKALSDARAAPPAPAPVAGPAKGFFDDPDAAFKRLEERLEKQIGPLRADIERATRNIAAQGVQERLATRHADWAEVKPYLDALLAKTDYPNPDDEGLLETLYYTAKGMMAEKGITFERPKGDAPVPDDTHKGPIPQHRVSSPPPPPKSPKDEKGSEVSWDDLDETERAMCKYYGQTPAEYREWQNADIEDIATSKIGLKKEEEA